MNWYSDVFNIVFANLDRDAANNAWKEQLAKPAEEDQHEKRNEEEEEE